MGCRASYQGKRLSMDCLTCGLGLTTPQCINSHLKVTSQLPKPWETMRYEEETIVELNEAKSKVISEYADIIRQVEALMLDPKTYGRSEDDAHPQRVKVLKEFYAYMFMDPLVAARVLENYSEESPRKSVFVEGHRNFLAWVKGILSVYRKCKFYKLCEESGDLRTAFLALLGLQSLLFAKNFMLAIPKDATPLKSDNASYGLANGLLVNMYDLPGEEVRLYTIENPVIESLPPYLQEMLKLEIEEGMKELRKTVDFGTIYDDKSREYAQIFIDKAGLEKIEITRDQAIAMGREAAAWVVGLGAPIENMALDQENITDIYIDGQNTPIYLEHSKFGLCHTLWRYNQEMLETAFRNIIMTLGGSRKFDKSNPIVDVVLTRLAMRCHLQRPPATFGELQAALRIMRDEPFTYPMYLKLDSLSPFFAGYDDVMIGLGCSEAVLGLKGVGKTAFTSAKIAAIGTKKRILPIQDIEEIPVKAYRKRGFHIGAVQVQSSERDEVGQTNELDLVSMTNAALRMGDACVIINEIRSRLAVQGVINMLNTQPGIFMLYNLHAQSLKDVQDRLELVFGLPAGSMFSTDRYTFLKKIRFGRKRRMYRMVGNQYETDLKEHKFVEVFRLDRKANEKDTSLKCMFLKNLEANEKSLSGIDLGSLSKNLSFEFIPPALVRRIDETGLPPEHYAMEAFFKGKIYSQIFDAYAKHSHQQFLEIDFVLECMTEASNLLRRNEREGKAMDWAAVDSEWGGVFTRLVETELRESKADLEAAMGKGKAKGSIGKLVEGGAAKKEKVETKDAKGPIPEDKAVQSGTAKEDALPQRKKGEPSIVQAGENKFADGKAGKKKMKANRKKSLENAKTAKKKGALKKKINKKKKR